MKRLLHTLMVALFATPFVALGQVVTTRPAIVQPDSEDVIVTFHADRGNAQLAGMSSAESIFVHSGVITDGSQNGDDWKYASDPEENSPKYKLVYVSDDTWEILIPSIKEFYNLPNDVNVTALAFVFRNEDGSVEGREATGDDIFVQVFPEGFQMTLGSDMDGLALTDSNPVNFTVNTTEPANIVIYLNSADPENVLVSREGVTSLSLAASFFGAGDYNIVAVATTPTDNQEREYGLTSLSDQKYDGGNESKSLPYQQTDAGALPHTS